MVADDARRERDLHDGAQRSAGLPGSLAEVSAPPEMPSLKERQASIVSGLTAVSSDLQQISRGIHRRCLPAATARMLAVEFARFLGLEFTGRANITDIVNAVCATAAHTRVELVFVDELHNLNLATRAGAEVSDQLKYFAVRYLQLCGCPSR